MTVSNVLSRPRAAALEWRRTPGLVAYPDAVAAMEARVEAIARGSADELVWLLEHPSVYTAGTSAEPAELLNPGAVRVYSTGRGGRYTYHGPGQRIAYVLLDLRSRGRDLRRYVQGLEEWVIRALADLGVTAERRTDRIGLWVVHGGREDKVAAIGVRVRRWITYHGIAVNVAPDLARFAGIVPCGVRGHGVTSLADLGLTAGMAELDAALARHFGAVFPSS